MKREKKSLGSITYKKSFKTLHSISYQLKLMNYKKKAELKQSIFKIHFPEILLRSSKTK
jgi:hypothetical protein